MKEELKENKVVIYQAKDGAIEFRGDFSRETIWATLNQIADLFSVQKAAISKNYEQFLSVVDDVKKLLPKGLVESKDAVELVSLFANTWLSLDAYDKELLPRVILNTKIKW